MEIDELPKIEPYNINMNVPKKHLLMTLLVLFLVGGFVVGFLCGMVYTDHTWKSFFKDFEMRTISNQYLKNIPYNFSYTPK